MKTIIRVGDKFLYAPGRVVEVIEVKPFGKLELFERAKSYFHSRYHREVKTWERVGQ